MKLLFVLAVIFASAMCIQSQYIEGSYLIQLKDGSTEDDIEEVIQEIEEHATSSRDEMNIQSDSTLLPIIFGNFDEETAEMVSELDSVELVEQDQIATIEMPFEDSNFTTEDNLTYSVPLRYDLDIIDDQKCIDGTYNPKGDGTGVDVYIIDSGINYDHIDFSSTSGKRRAYFLTDEINPKQYGWDYTGHGTHCAGTAGGLYSGVAKNVNLFSIRVLNAKGRGSYSGVVKGMLKGYEHHKSRVGKSGFKGSVFSMSLGGSKSTFVDENVNAIVEGGVIIVTSSGNDRHDACRNSPGSAGLNINVGAHSYMSLRSGCKKPMFARSNYGKCVDIVAPGVNILSADYKTTNGYKKLTGTSMACPHVAGTAALVLERYTTTPAGVKSGLQHLALNDLDKSNLPVRDATRRLYLDPRYLLK